MARKSSVRILLLYAVTIFVSAVLLFQVQPIISKMILPWFGGSPAVWTTCMLFFQVTLLAGYAYAHGLIRFARPARQGIWHAGLLIAALVVLPVVPADSWKPDGQENPVGRILLLLLVTVGPPFFILSATGPLLQAWFSRLFAGHSPYRLYALSNVGSLLALLAYPFLLEPRTTTTTQGYLWSGGFLGFVVLCGLVSLGFRRFVIDNQSTSAIDLPVDSTAAARPAVHRLIVWILLPAFASMMLLAITNHICQDIAVVPFLWIAPLSLYLLTFIICFDRPRWYARKTLALATVLVTTTIVSFELGDSVREWLLYIGVDVTLPDLLDHIVLEIGLYLGLLFGICMLCHGETVRLKPEPRHLTLFYLCLSAGGALGGLTVAVVCPLVFAYHTELPIGMITAVGLALFVLGHGLWQLLDDWPLLFTAAVAILFALVASVAVWLVIHFVRQTEDEDVIAAKRNFYGALQIEQRGHDNPRYERRALYNGRILHGLQFLHPERRREPTLYYNPTSGIGLTLQYFPREGLGLRVAAIGLGAGTLAAYGEPGDRYVFYEINPQVVELNQKYFSYVSDSLAQVEIVPGDARLSMENERDSQQFDVMALDAFTGDAIPTHLLTVESFELYLRHLQPDGVLAFHISNRHLDLRPVVVALAYHFKMQVVEVDAEDLEGPGDAGSLWLLVTNNSEFLQDDQIFFHTRDVPLDKPLQLWTDKYSNLLNILD